MSFSKANPIVKFQNLIGHKTPETGQAIHETEYPDTQSAIVAWEAKKHTISIPSTLIF